MDLKTVKEMHELWRQIIIISSCLQKDDEESVYVPSFIKEGGKMMVSLEFPNGNGKSQKDGNGNS
jgi:hypothetical protein